MELGQLFRDLIAHPAAVEMVKDVLGESFLISNFTANIARPGSRSMALHLDQSLVFPEPWRDSWALDVAWYLTDVRKGERRHPVHPRLEQVGVWHTSGSNLTEDEGRALLFGYYMAPSMRQQVNWTAKLPKEIQDRLSPEMREWLGSNPVGNIGYDEGTEGT